MKIIKISDKAHEELSKLAQQFSLSIADTVEKLIDFFKYPSISSEKPIKSKLDVEIFLKYPTKCAKCKREISQGERARYIKIEYEDSSKDIIILCEDCNLNSSLLAKYYKKKKEYEAIIKELRNEADNLVKRINKYKVEYDIVRVKAEVYNIYNDIKNYLLDQERFKIDEIIRRIDEINEKVQSLEKIKKPIVIYKFKKRTKFT